MRRRALLLGAAALFGCTRRKPPVESGQLRYVLGGAYEANGAWYYPAARYAAEETGLAMIQVRHAAALTANGEVFDQGSLAAAHQTLQIPAIARVTNLETGLQVVLRINDRGPARPDRILAVTERTAELLRFPATGVARIRLEVLPEPSHAAVDALGGAPEERIDVAAAPRDVVVATDLPPPGSGLPAAPAATPVHQTEAGFRNAAPPPLRMPEEVTRVVPEPGMLWIDLGRFSRSEFAKRQAARSSLATRVEQERRGRDTSYRVVAGPFASIAEADAAFAQARRAGVSDARIVIQ